MQIFSQTCTVHSWRKHPFPDLQLQVVSAVLRNLIDHNWLIQMAATRALRLNQPAESQEARASTVRCDCLEALPCAHDSNEGFTILQT